MACEGFFTLRSTDEVYENGYALRDATDIEAADYFIVKCLRNTRTVVQGISLVLRATSISRKM
jgi:hypothetical protein